MWSKIREIQLLADKASRHYGQLRLILFIRIVYFRFRYSFWITEIPVYDLLGKGPNPFTGGAGLSTRNVARWLHRLNPPSAKRGIEQKVYFHARCERLGIPVPRVYATGIPTPELIDQLPDRFLVKPACGAGGGFGVSAFTRQGTEFREWDGHLHGRDELVRHLARHTGGGELLFQEWLVNHAAIQPLSSTALLTLRIGTINHPATATGPDVLFAYLKVPSGNVLTDNVHLGCNGEARIELDWETGRPLAAWLNHPSGFGVIARDRIDRPERVLLEQLQMPDWERVRELVGRLIQHFPDLPSVGWDIALSDRGPVVIEGNPAWGIPTIPSVLPRIAGMMERIGPLREAT